MKHLQKESDRTWSRKVVSLLALAALLNGSLLAETAAPTPLKGESIKIGKKFTLHSGILNEDRQYCVYLPPSYEDKKFPAKRYPVLYLLDGDIYFLSASGMVHHMCGGDDAEIIQIPELIVVAVLDKDRRKDFTPSHTLKDYDGRENPNLASSGGADAFLKFLKEELIPQIGSQYRTVPYRILMGHSLSGLFVVNTFLEQPSLFQAYLAFDPSIWWDDQLLAREAKKVLPQATDLRNSFYLCTVHHGSDSIKWDISLEEFAALLKTNASPQLRSKFQRFDSEDHSTVGLMGLYEGLLFTFDGYKPSGSAADDPVTLNKHFTEVSKRLGFKFPPPEQYVNIEAYAAWQNNDIDKAIAYFKLNTMNYPLSFHAHDNLATACATKGDDEMAIKNYKKSVELNPKDQDAVDQLKNLESETKVDPAVYGSLVGKYDYGHGAVQTVTREGNHLFVQMTGQQKGEIFPTSETNYFLKAVVAQITFVKDTSGKVTKVIHHQNGKTFDAPKIQ